MDEAQYEVLRFGRANEHEGQQGEAHQPQPKGTGRPQRGARDLHRSNPEQGRRRRVTLVEKHVTEQDGQARDQEDDERPKLIPEPQVP